MHVLHAIHDFLPRHRAGSEIYALELARAQMARHDVTVLCAEYDASREHGRVVWRIQDGVPVVELINNWRCESFEDTYRSPLITERIRHVLRTLKPDVVHVHNLLNLSFDLPACAQELGIPVVATLHDYTLVCASGGQRVHRGEQHVCTEIEPERCARCFKETPFYSQAAFGRVAGGGARAAVLGRAAAVVRRVFPAAVAHAAKAVHQVGGLAVTATDVEARLAAAQKVFRDVDLFVSPSSSLAREFEELGIPSDRLIVSDYGMVPMQRRSERAPQRPLRIGFVGTLVWHKGVHVLMDALRTLPSGAYRALIFGDTRVFPDYTATLRQRATGLPVDFMDGFTSDRTEDVYEQFDVLVVPSLWLENSPLVIHEAFMKGVPVVGSRMGGIPDLVTDGVNGFLFESGSSADLARVLRQLIDRPSFVTELAAGAPPVKTITVDANEWDGVYVKVRRAEVVSA